MERIPEPELMDDPEQVHAYASANFSEPDSEFMRLFIDLFGRDVRGYVLDLGCGPGNISFRFAGTFPDCIVHAIDGSREMIKMAREFLSETPELRSRLFFIEGILPDINPPLRFYDVIISNSLLHHLHDPLILWNTVKRFSRESSIIFVRDLKRPSSEEEAMRIVETYSGNEPDILKRDFYNSLLASFTVQEVEDQLLNTGLDYLKVKESGDRHLIIYGGIKHGDHSSDTWV
ncbi:MAG: class I SAM-dependent methyltransferase [Thermodesulfovibrionales bacterium]|nr:class I SAM-dependent methyltransferase [Thermodesulfovibrionales bacterium]